MSMITESLESVLGISPDTMQPEQGEVQGESSGADKEKEVVKPMTSLLDEVNTGFIVDNLQDIEDVEFAQAVEQLEAEAQAAKVQQKEPKKPTEKQPRKTRSKAQPKQVDTPLPKTQPAKPQALQAPQAPQAPQKTKVEEVEEEYEIETIVSHRLYRSAVVSYEVQWKGYSAEENTVEKADSLHNDVADLCAAYWDSLTDTPRPINAPASRNNSSQTTPSVPTTHNVAAAAAAATTTAAAAAADTPASVAQKQQLAPIFRNIAPASPTLPATPSSSGKKEPTTKKKVTEVPKRVTKKAAPAPAASAKKATPAKTPSTKTAPKTVPRKVTAVKPISKTPATTATTGSSSSSHGNSSLKKGSGSSSASASTSTNHGAKKGNAASSSLKRVKNGESSESHKKTKFDSEHVPQYMTERGFSYPKTWPNLKTKWETDMVKLRAVQLSPIDKNIKMAYIEWKNGDKTIHTLDECHKKCPEKLIEFYEERLRFV